MKSARKLLYIVPLLALTAAVSCTDVENMDMEHIGGYATMNNAERVRHITPIFALIKLQLGIMDVLSLSDGTPTGLPQVHIGKGIFLPCRTVWILFPCGAVLPVVTR